MRKRLVNKEKFQFNEEDVLPPTPPRMGKSRSMQSRLCKKADDINNPSQMAAPSISSQDHSKRTDRMTDQQELFSPTRDNDHNPS